MIGGWRVGGREAQRSMLRLCPILALVVALGGCGRDESVARLRVAVASSFSTPADRLADQFAAEEGVRVVLIPGATGKHYAQIVNGAPFDLFLAADDVRPRLLEQRGLGVGGTRFTYALGQLVLWSAELDDLSAGDRILRGSAFRRLAIANPEIAPYGLAARQTLEALDLWQTLERKIVRGENVGHAYHFVASRNADLGFVSMAQILGSDVTSVGSYWVVPQELYRPIRQQAILIADSSGGREFLRFLRGQSARSILEDYGFGLP